ncbi:LysR family transcriptional regulator [Sphingobium scionense]
MNDLRLFAAVVTHGGFAAAGGRCACQSRSSADGLRSWNSDWACD